MDINREPEDYITRYAVEYGICDRCMKRPYDITTDELGRFYDLSESDKEKFRSRIKEIEEEEGVPVFSFIADCGGDAIYLCAGCLRDILLEMQALEAGAGETP